MNKRTFGNKAEAFVAQHLKYQGFAIVERNYQKLYGEIDIIAQKDDIFAFVEVKLRRSSPVPIQASISRTKQKKIILVAREYIAKNRIIDKVCRFDAALVQIDQNEQMELMYIENAFGQ
ncbi:MAG: YraN family protein [Candidatus Dependentiae bacterium]